MADLGQIQFYVNYYDRERRPEGRQPDAGIDPLSDRMTPWSSTRSGSSRPQDLHQPYQLYLPTEEELQIEIRRELRQLVSPASKPTRKRHEIMNRHVNAIAGRLSCAHRQRRSLEMAGPHHRDCAAAKGSRHSRTGRRAESDSQRVPIRPRTSSASSFAVLCARHRGGARRG